MKKFKTKEYKKPKDKKYIIVENPWGRDLRKDMSIQQVNNIGAWLEIAIRSQPENTDFSHRNITLYHQGTHINVIVEIPAKVDVQKLLGVHQHKSFLTGHYRDSTEDYKASIIFEYNYERFGDPEEILRWDSDFPNYDLEEFWRIGFPVTRPESYPSPPYPLPERNGPDHSFMKWARKIHREKTPKEEEEEARRESQRNRDEIDAAAAASGLHRDADIKRENEERRQAALRLRQDMDTIAERDLDNKDAVRREVKLETEEILRRREDTDALLLAQAPVKDEVKAETEGVLRRRDDIEASIYEQASVKDEVKAEIEEILQRRDQIDDKLKHQVPVKDERASEQQDQQLLQSNASEARPLVSNVGTKGTKTESSKSGLPDVNLSAFGDRPTYSKRRQMNAFGDLEVGNSREAATQIPSYVPGSQGPSPSVRNVKQEGGTSTFMPGQNSHGSHSTYQDYDAIPKYHTVSSSFALGQGPPGYSPRGTAPTTDPRRAPPTTDPRRRPPPDPRLNYRPQDLSSLKRRPDSPDLLHSNHTYGGESNFKKPRS